MPRLTYELTAGALSAGLLFVPLIVEAQAERADSPSSTSEHASEDDPFLRKEERNLPPGAEELPPPSAGELLLERARELDAREAELEQAKRDLALLEKKVEERIHRLETLLKEKVRVEQGILSDEEQKRRSRLDRMTEVTSRMPPERAALYLSELPVKTVAKILSGMKSRRAAAIMAAMLPSKAAEVSRKYLESGKSSRPAQSESRASDARESPAGQKTSG